MASRPRGPSVQLQPKLVQRVLRLRRGDATRQTSLRGPSCIRLESGQLCLHAHLTLGGAFGWVLPSAESPPQSRSGLLKNTKFFGGRRLLTRHLQNNNQHKMFKTKTLKK